ncbi:hypothetical protein ACIBLA_22765 [Streptomyces sp. NPDC050433]|uniref:hypothetical protein n=1 Tax=Streptomyces sp. NPDC050433 TaxID=3365615 RepID=UPI00378B3109
MERENPVRREPSQERGREPTGAMTQMRHLTGEVERIAVEAGIGARRAQRRGKFWNATHLMLGFPAAVLAAVSGAAGFSSGSAFLRAEARQLANLRRRYAWQEVEVRARLVLAREAYMTEEDLYAALSRLLEQRRAVPSSRDRPVRTTGPATAVGAASERLTWLAQPFVLEPESRAGAAIRSVSGGTRRT